MQKMVFKQLLFLILLAMVLIVVFGLVMVPHASAQNQFKHFLQDWDWDDDWGDDWSDVSKISYEFRYNRVEGIYLGFRINEEYWRDRYPKRPFVFGSSGYGFSSKQFIYQVGLEKGFSERFRTALGGEIHNFVDTPDDWIMPYWENSLAAFLLKEDFNDFYIREGGSGYITQNFTETLKLTLSYNFENFSSEKKNTNWSLFGSKKKFRGNPDMFPYDSLQQMQSIKGQLVFDTRNSFRRTSRGWYIQIEGEHAGNDLKGDYQFDRMFIDIRRYQPLGFSDGFDFRIRAGTSKGILPFHKSYHLGGVSTLRGFSYKAYPAGPMMPGGNRMVLAQLEYRLGMQDFPDELGFGILDNFNLILFVDTGWVGAVDPDLGLFKGFDSLTWNDLKTDFGIAIANRTGNVRLQIARRTDTSKDPYVFTFRISRPF